MTDFQRRAVSSWNGDLKSGNGKITAESNAFRDLDVSFATRFVNAKNDNKTNPEELIAAAHAACFNMAFSAGLAEAGQAPEHLETEATVTLTPVDGGFRVSRIHLQTEGKVTGIDDAAFRKAAEGAKENCPISNLLTPGVDEVTLEAKLIS